jgi:NAD-dependent deacetylase
MTGDAELVGLLDGARRVLVFTGAGISTGSGIGDYRGPSGVWKVRQPVYFNDFMARQEARVEYWDQKLESWPEIRDAQPNATHHAIAKLEAAGRVLMVVTQNIDGLHEKAGTSRDLLVELHGTNLAVECMSCHAMSDPQPHFDAFGESGEAPICGDCGGYLKPATISFGQNLRADDLQRAFGAGQGADLVLALGSTLSVQPAASIPLMAVQRGVPYVIINRGITEHDDIVGVTLRLEGDVSEILPPAVEAMLNRRPAEPPSRRTSS